MTPEGSGEERLRAELAAARAQLGAAKQLLDQVVRSIPLECAVVDRQGRAVHVSAALAEPFGLEPEDLVGKGLDELFPEQGKVVERLARQVFETQKPLQKPASRGGGPRDPRWPSPGRSELELVPLRGEGGDVTHLAVALTTGGTALDATDPLLKNVALRVIMNAVPALIAYVDREERYRICNEMFRAWHGAAPETFLGRTVREVVGDAAYAAIAPHVKAALSGRQVAFESWIPDLQGGRRWVESTLTPHMDAGGQVLGFIALTQDVSERKQVESQREELLARVAASEARFRRIHESGVIGVVFWSRGGAITDANDAFLEMVGYSREELVAGRVRWRDMTPPEYALLDERALAEIAQRSFCTTYEKEYIHKDGHRVPVLIAGASWDGSDDEGVAWILDITRRKQEEERRELLIEVGRLLSSSANLDETLSRVTRLVVWSVASFAAIELLDGDGRQGETTMFAHRDPDLERSALDVWRSAVPRDAHPAAVVARTGKRQMLQADGPATEGAGARAEGDAGAHARLLEGLGVRSLVVVPLLSRGRVLGVLSFGSSERRYDAEDLRLAEELGGRAGTAIDNARLAEERQHVAQLLDTVIEQAPIGMIVFDQDLRYTRVNKALAELNGIPPEAHIGRSVRDIIPSIDPKALETLSRVLRSGEPAFFETEAETPAMPGVVRSFAMSCYPVRLRGEVIAVGAMVYEVTERKRVDKERERLLEAERQARRALAESEEHFRLVANSIPLLAWIAEADGQITWYNQRWYEYTGTSPGAPPAWSWQSVQDPEELPRVARVWKQAIDAGTPWEDQLRLRRGSDGAFRWFLSRAVPLRDGQGRILRWFGMNVDIDDQKRAQAQMDALLEAAPTGIALLDKDLRYLRVNKALAELNGLPVEAHPGKGLADILPEVAEQVTPIFHRVLETGMPVQNLEVSDRPRRRPGAEVHLLANFYPVRVGDETVGLAALIIDITDRKRAELQAEFLASVGAALSSLTDPGSMLSHTAELVVSGLADVCVIYTSDGAADDLHLSAVAHVDAEKAALLRDAPAFRSWAQEASLGPAAVVRTGRSIFLRELPAGAPGLASPDAEPLRALAESGMTSWILVPIVIQSRPYGAIGLGLTTVGRRFDERDRAVAEELGRRVGIALDNARLFSAAQRERTRAEEAARAKDEFLAVVSHELRTPLNAMLGWTRMLRSGQLPEATAKRALEVVERNAILQSQLIEDILDVSRIVTGNMRIETAPVDLPQVVHAAVDTLKPAAEAKEVQIALQLAAPGLSCTGDPARLQQVVWNLVSNAVKFTDKGGRVEVRMARTDAHLELTVEDTGRGIAPEFLPHMFERFRQADAGTTRTHGGLGLGLAIVKHIVELHGGTIRASSAGLGKGATFVVSLPAAPRRPSSPSPGRAASAVSILPEAVQQMAELRGLRVLVVDDEEDARDLLASVLSLAGVQVTTASGVEEAMQLVRAVEPEVVVSDIGMPGEDGYALIQRLRSLPPERGGRTPAIALTAYARIEERTKALLAGFNMHIPKPIEPSELLVVVANVSGRLSPTRGAPGAGGGGGLAHGRVT